MLAAMGVILVLAASAVLVIGLIRCLFPQADRFVPADWQEWLNVKTAMLLFVSGLLLIQIS